MGFWEDEFGLGDRHLLDEMGFGMGGGLPFVGEFAAGPVEAGVTSELEQLFGTRDGIAGDGGLAFRGTR